MPIIKTLLKIDQELKDLSTQPLPCQMEPSHSYSILYLLICFTSGLKIGTEPTFELVMFIARAYNNHIPYMP